MYVAGMECLRVDCNVSVCDATFVEGHMQFSLYLSLGFPFHTDSRDPYTEEEAARITSAILSAISYVRDIEFVFFRVFVF